jgi:hypothetical protein
VWVGGVLVMFMVCGVWFVGVVFWWGVVCVVIDWLVSVCGLVVWWWVVVFLGMVFVGVLFMFC